MLTKGFDSGQASAAGRSAALASDACNSQSTVEFLYKRTLQVTASILEGRHYRLTRIDDDIIVASMRRSIHEDRSLSGSRVDAAAAVSAQRGLMRRDLLPAAASNAFTVDVEEYFQVSAFSSVISRDDWDQIPLRVEQNVDRLLGILDDASTVATFFTLGWIAKRRPALIRRIAAAGHEVASHGFDHTPATRQTRQAVRRDIVAARQLLQDVTGQPVVGYRAPSFSIGAGNLWVYDLLKDAGHCYSSSVYPIIHDHYGMPSAPRFVHEVRPGLVEIPPTTVRIGGKNVPAGGGGYFRLLPYAASRWSLRRVAAQDDEPAVFYCHPWELDPGQPRVAKAGLLARFRHYVNLGRTQRRIESLLRDFRWARVDQVFAHRIANDGMR